MLDFYQYCHNNENWNVLKKFIDVFQVFSSIKYQIGSIKYHRKKNHPGRVKIIIKRQSLYQRGIIGEKGGKGLSVARLFFSYIFLLLPFKKKCFFFPFSYSFFLNLKHYTE